MHSELAVLTPEAYNQIFTMHAMTMILVCAAYSHRLCRLPYSSDDRRGGPGLSPSQCVHLLGLSGFRKLFIYIAVSRPGAARRLVRLRSLHADQILTGHGHGFLCQHLSRFSTRAKPLQPHYLRSIQPTRGLWRSRLLRHAHRSYDRQGHRRHHRLRRRTASVPERWTDCRRARDSAATPPAPIT